jgi:hypothetical protein
MQNLEYVTDGQVGVSLDFQCLKSVRLTEEHLFVLDNARSVTVHKDKNPKLIDLILDIVKTRSNVEVISTAANDASEIEYRIEYNYYTFEVSFPDKQNLDRAVKALENQSRFLINTSARHRFLLQASVNPYFRKFNYDANRASLEELLKA